MRGKTTALLFFLSVLIAIAGCASTGTVAGLKKGDTTMEEVKAKFGEPNSRTSGQDGDVWVYKFVRDSRDRDRHHTELDLKITFKDRTVEDYQVTVSELLDKPGPRGDDEREPRHMPRRLPPQQPPGRPPF